MVNIHATLLFSLCVSRVNYGATLSPFFFVLVTDIVGQDIQRPASYKLCYADDMFPASYKKADLLQLNQE